MAGEWLKFDKATPDKPEVFAIASELGIDPDAVVGKLMRVWSWFDTHTADGNAVRVTPALLDRIAGVPGFVSAMAKTGWIAVETDSCRLPNFDRHCGETAKTRALGAKRSAGFRVRNAPTVTSASPREEKRREEKKDQKKKQDAPIGADPLEGIDKQIATDFRKLRGAKKAAITPTAIAGIKREADKAGLSLQNALAMCCERGWSGFKAEWVNGHAAPPAAPLPRLQS